MTKEKLALSDFFKTHAVVFASGVENKDDQQNLNGLPICKTSVKVNAKAAKLARDRRVCVK